MRPFLVIALSLLLAACQGVLVHDVRSPYSHIQVRDSGSSRALMLIGDSGREAIETLVDLERPHLLQQPYTRTLMAGFLYRPDAVTCLLVGLGGGAMVRFLNRYFPELQVDAVEIDPVMVDIAMKYFGTAPGPRTRIFTADGFEFVRRSRDRYDIALIDVHLHPGAETDSSGHPLRLNTEAFLRNLRERLRPDGVALFNIIEGPDTAASIASIRAVYEVVDIFRPPWTGNVIVAALPAGPGPGAAQLRERGRSLDRRGDHGFSFERLVDERSGPGME